MHVHHLQGVCTALGLQPLPGHNLSFAYPAIQHSSSVLPDFFCIKTAILEMIEHFAIAQEKLKEQEAGRRIRGIK